MLNLHVGCNHIHIDGFVNIDALSTEAADFVCDIRYLSKYFKNESVDYIYTCHVLEHISRHEYKKVLQDFYSLLKPGSLVRISVPDFQALIEYYMKIGDLNEIRGTLFGGQKNVYDYHKWTWDFKSLEADLKEAGFHNIQRYDPNTTSHAHIRDWSRDYVPRHDANGQELSDDKWMLGKLVSLNVEAQKL